MEAMAAWQGMFMVAQCEAPEGGLLLVMVGYLG